MSQKDETHTRPIRHVLVPKPGGGDRALAVLHPVDSAAYRSAVGKLADVIERALGPGVLANRVAPGPGLRLESWRTARRRLDRARATMRHAPAVLRTDVRDCYPSMRPDVVEGSLVRLGGSMPDAASVRIILEDFQARGVRGLPVGPEPSAVLANAVLTVTDRTLERDGLVFVRWVDDIWAAAPSRARAGRALERLGDALDALGLRVAEEKTAVLERGSLEERRISASSAL